jgi:hypothetical protein
MAIPLAIWSSSPDRTRRHWWHCCIWRSLKPASSTRALNAIGYARTDCFEHFRQPTGREALHVAARQPHLRARCNSALRRGLGRQQPSGSYRRQPAPPRATHTRFRSAGRLARSSGVAGYGLVQLAEGLLDAGFDLARTMGTVLECRGWFGRELRQPGPGLVGDWAGLVALGAVEAIIRVWRWEVGHDGHPGSRSGRAAKPAPRSGGNV